MTIDAARPARPTQVTVAFWLQLAAVALLLGLIGAAVAYAFYFDGEISRAARLVPDADPAEVSDERVGNIFMTSMVGVPALLLAIWLAATATAVRRGSNAGRILVFVAAGGQLLFCALQSCGGLFAVPFVFMASGPELPDDGETPWEDVPWEESEFYETLYSGSDPLLDILFPVAGLGTFLVLMLVGAVVLLLALPPASRYFVPSARPSTPEQPLPAVGHPAFPTGYPYLAGHSATVGYPTAVSYPAAIGYPALASYPICPDPGAHLPPTTAADPGAAASTAAEPAAAASTAAPHADPLDEAPLKTTPTPPEQDQP